MRSASLNAERQPLALPQVLQIAILAVAHQKGSDVAVVGDHCWQDKWISRNFKSATAATDDLTDPAAVR